MQIKALIVSISLLLLIVALFYLIFNHSYARFAEEYIYFIKILRVARFCPLFI